jgi:isocitrate lyase
MELNAVDLMAFMLFSQIVLAGLVIYSFLDQEREARKRTNAMFAQMEKLLAELEKRLASGMFRTPDELDRVIARNASQATTGDLKPAAGTRRPAPG